MTTDEELMIRLKEGDEDALADLYERHSGKIWAYVLKHAPRGNAEDLFQDAFVKLVEKKQYWNGQPFILWFYVVVRNLVTDFHRHQVVEQKAFRRLGEEILPTEKAELKELIAELPPESAALLTELYKEGLTYQELSEKYGLTELSLRKRVSRVLSFLRKGENHGS